LTEWKSTLGKPIDVWIHGHTHVSLDYNWKINGNEKLMTRVVCNPRGYPWRGLPENDKFDPNKIIEV
jgi:hypothetical protein